MDIQVKVWESSGDEVHKSIAGLGNEWERLRNVQNEKRVLATKL